MSRVQRVRSCISRVTSCLSVVQGVVARQGVGVDRSGRRAPGGVERQHRIGFGAGEGQLALRLGQPGSGVGSDVCRGARR